MGQLSHGTPHAVSAKLHPLYWRRTGQGVLAVLSQQSGASPALKGVNHVWTGRVVIHERSVGIQRSSSNTLTARRCEVFSSGAIITVARRPGPPVVVRTRVARISARSLIIARAESPVPSAIFARLTSPKF